MYVDTCTASVSVSFERNDNDTLNTGSRTEEHACSKKGLVGDGDERIWTNFRLILTGSKRRSTNFQDCHGKKWGNRTVTRPGWEEAATSHDCSRKAVLEKVATTLGMERTSGSRATWIRSVRATCCVARVKARPTTAVGRVGISIRSGAGICYGKRRAVANETWTA